MWRLGGWSTTAVVYPWVDSNHSRQETATLVPKEGRHQPVTDLDWQPIARMRTHEQVIAEIENRLRSGTLRAGDRLPPERQLAEALNVSRGAVREALRILEAIGVVEAGTGSGPTSGSTIVTDGAGGFGLVLRMHLQAASLSHDDLVEVRVVLERLAVRKATADPDVDSIARLRAIVEKMRTTTSSAEYNELDMAFHIELATMSNNDLVTVLMTALRSTLRQAMVDAFGRLEDPGATMDALTQEHSAIVDAVAKPDGDEAARLVTSHISDFYHLTTLSEPL